MEQKYEKHTKGGKYVEDFILGWQDGLVNVLGLVLGVASATHDNKLIIISGLAALFAESVAMAAVSYTSTKASREYYQKELEREIYEIKHYPDIETQEIRDIYKSKGFKGKDLEMIVKTITSDRKLWLKVMMEEELHLYPEEKKPVKTAAIVGMSAVLGSLVPLIAFFFVPASNGILATVIVSMLVLFFVGVLKSRYSTVSWKRSSLEMVIIGTVAALFGYTIGILLGTA